MVFKTTSLSVIHIPYNLPTQSIQFKGFNTYTGFPNRSAGRESTFNAGEPSLILGSGRFPEEGIGYPLQYSWASLVAQLVKNWPTMQETWV